MDRSNPITQMEVEVQANSILYSRSKQESGPLSRSQHSLAFTVPILSHSSKSQSQETKEKHLRLTSQSPFLMSFHWRDSTDSLQKQGRSVLQPNSFSIGLT